MSDEQLTPGAAAAQWMLDRKNVMEKLEIEAFKAYMIRWDVGESLEGMSDNDIMASMHYARIEMKNWPKDGQDLSRKWLEEHGYRMPEELREELP